jgi:hypothetical protein
LPITLAADRPAFRAASGRTREAAEILAFPCGWRISTAAFRKWHRTCIDEGRRVPFMPVDIQSPFHSFAPAAHPRHGSTANPAGMRNDGFAAILASAAPAAASDGTATAPAEAEGGPDPSFMDPRDRTLAFTRRDWKPQADSEDFHPFGDDGLTIDDVIDVVNPLQHIPVVSTVYRWLTGDTISPAAELAGGALYGGVVGLAASAATVAVDGLMGGSADQQLMVALLGPSPFADDGAATTTDNPSSSIDLAQAPAADDGMPASRGAGLAQAALNGLASSPTAAAPALQEVPADLLETLSKLPNAAHDQNGPAPAPSAAPTEPVLAVQPAATAQPQVIGAGSVSDSLPVVIPQTAAASARVTAAPPPTASNDGTKPLLQSNRTLKPLPPPLPAGFTIRNPPPIDTGGLGRSLPAKLTPANLQQVDTATVPAAMTRALDSYRKMMQERNREAVPVPGLDFQS